MEALVGLTPLIEYFYYHWMSVSEYTLVIAAGCLIIQNKIRDIGLIVKMKITLKGLPFSWIGVGGGGHELLEKITRLLFIFTVMVILEFKGMVYQKHHSIHFITLQKAMKAE